MTIKQIYALAIKLAINADLRGKEGVAKKLKREKKKYDSLSDKEKKLFDKERLTNPYSDSRFLYGDENQKVDTIMIGIDISTGEIMLADRLREKGKKIDLIISHHPLGKALANLDDVMELQVDILEQEGVPVNIAEGLQKKRMGEVALSVASANHYKSVDAAKLMDFPIMCLHTACDNLVAKFIDKKLKALKPDTVGDIVEMLMKIPEYKIATEQKAGPTIFNGSKDNRAGKVTMTEITGGTNGSKDVYEKLSNAGIGTILGMHMHEEYKQEAIKNHLNIIIAGHMASDSLGINLFLDQLERRGVKIIPCSGFIRVKRK